MTYFTFSSVSSVEVHAHTTNIILKQAFNSGWNLGSLIYNYYPQGKYVLSEFDTSSL